MKRSTSHEAALLAGALDRRGLSLVEVVVAVVILGASFIPMLGMQRQHMERSRSNQRVAIAESLVRDAIEHLRWRKRNNGFDWLWNNAGSWTSGISNPGGNAAMNPALDAKFRMGTQDPTNDRFDRIVQVRRRWTEVPDPAITGSADPNAGPDLDAGSEDIRFLEILVTIHCFDDPMLAPRGPGQRSYFQIVTYIADFPAS